MYKHEFTMVTKHFKHVDDKVKQQVSDLIKLGEPGPGARINHSCLIGYDWDEYGNIADISHKELADQFRSRLANDAKRLIKLLDKRFVDFEKKFLRFEIFFIPFPSVVEFRNAFNEALD
jgi:hypothetical protein